MSLHVGMEPDVFALVRRFHDCEQALGVMERVDARQMPGPYQRLLDHDTHMTPTLEMYHGCAMRLAVLDWQIDHPWYARHVRLLRVEDDAVVLYGIARVNLEAFEASVRQQIEGALAPLGRILSQRESTRRVRPASLWRVWTGPWLTGEFGLSQPVETFGRTVTMAFRGRRAFELLEIAAPLL